MVTTKPGKRVLRRSIYLGTAIALLALVAGFGIAASFTVIDGPALGGGGVYHATNAIPWWTETSIGVSVQPGALPPTVSGVVGAPTVLAGAAASYAINPAVANDVGQFWKFSESAGATASTELELAFTVSTGVVPVIASFTVYVETQVAPPGAATTFTFYYDLGSAAAGTITLNSVTEIAQQCSAVGTCP